jgi:hypothetical protein
MRFFYTQAAGCCYRRGYHLRKEIYEEFEADVPGKGGVIPFPELSTPSKSVGYSGMI